MIVQNKGLPFEVKIPNSETAKVIKEARQRVNVDDFSFDEIKG
jgi:antitoxin component of RelBE/YafQ-DinJ toxin-antitoxin module